jgi:hypothetical protein
MRAADIEWSMLRGALIGLGIGLVVAIAMVGASRHFLESNDKVFKKADRGRRAAYDEYRNLDNQEQMIATYYPLFQALEKEGIIGDERRLKWTEALDQADSILKLPGLSYSISARKRHSTEFPLEEGAYKLYASEMTLDLGLLHGQDLLRLFNRLDEDADGLYSIDSCAVSRSRQDPGSPKETHLKSTCKLYWYTINKPREQG